MAESKDNYQLANLDLSQLNFVLQRMADRLDALEGYRGTPTFQADVDMNGNKVTSVATGTSTTDAATTGQVSGLTTDNISEGTHLYYTDTRAQAFHNAITGGHASLKQATNEADASASSVSVTSLDAGAAYTAAEQGLINEIKGDLNQLVTDANATVTKLNTLLANLRTAGILV